MTGGGALMPFLSNSTNPLLLKWISEKRFYLSTPFQKVVSLSIMSNDKNMHKSGWMRPSRPNEPRKIEEARQIAKDTYSKARASKASEVKDGSAL